MQFNRICPQFLGILIWLGSTSAIHAQGNRDDQNPFKELTPGKAASTKLPPAEYRVIQLPSTLSAIAAGDSGRILAMHLPEILQLAVVDVSAGKIVKLIPLDSNDLSFAASRDKLLIVKRDKRIIERWSLESFKREVSASFPTDKPILEVIAGSDSTERALVVIGDGNYSEFRALDVESMNLVEGKSFATGARRSRLNRPPYFRISPNGKVVVTNGRVLEVRETDFRMLEHPGIDLLGTVPNYDGSVLYTPSMIVTTSLTAIGQRVSGKPTIPSTQPGYYLSLPRRNTKNQPPGVLALHAEGDARPLCALPEIDLNLSTPRDYSNPADLDLDHRFWYVPSDSTLVQIPRPNEELILHRIEVQKILDRLGVDFLYVASQAPITARLGKVYQYQLDVRSKRGGVTFELTNAPPEMSVDESGKISWLVPPSFDKASRKIGLRISDRSGQVLTHAFVFRIPEVSEAEENALKEILQSQREAALAMAAGKENSIRLSKLQRSGEQAKTALERIAISNLQGFRQRMKIESRNPLRSWTDSDGNRIQARFASVFAGTVELQRTDNRIVSVQIESLSDEDRKYIDEVRKESEEKRKKEEAIKRDTSAPLDELQIIALGFRKKYFARGEIPDAYSCNLKGEPLLSWRVHLLPALGSWDLYRMFNLREPWNSEHNLKLLPYMPAFYQVSGSKAGTGKTNFLALRSEKSLIQPPKPAPNLGISPSPLIQIDRPASRTIPPDMAQSALVVEVPDSAAVEWTRPDDWHYDAADAGFKQIQFREQGVYTVLSDGTVTLVNESTSPEALERMLGAVDDANAEK